MAGSDVTSVYRSIIDEVITKSRHEFVQEDVDEAVLDELRVLWEEKLQQTGVLAPEPPRLVAGGGPGGHAVHTGFYQPLPQHIAAYYSAQARGIAPQLGRPNAYLPAASTAQGQIATSAAYVRPQSHFPIQSQVLRPPTAQQPTSSLQQPASHYQGLQRPTPQYTSHQGLYQFIQGLSQQQQQQQRQQAAQQQAAVHRPAASYQRVEGQIAQQQQQQTAQQLHQGPAASSAPQYNYRQSNQHDSVGAAVGQKRKAEDEQASSRTKPPGQSMQEMLYGSIPQQDGPADGSADEASPDKAAGAEADEEEAVDNLSDVPSTDNDEEEEISNHCISQYTKVSRTKNRWKAQLLAGILHLNGRDHIFHSAIGEFQF